MCILESIKVPIYEFHYDYIKNKYGKSSDTDSFMYEIETQKVFDDFSKNKECFILVIILAKSKYYNDSNTLVVGNMKDEMVGVAIEEFAGLKLKMYSILLSNSSEYKNAKAVSKNVVTKMSHSEYKNVLSNKTCLRHSMNRIQSKIHQIRTYELNKISFFCFDIKFIFLIMELML